jgi:hypothetical protein
MRYLLVLHCAGAIWTVQHQTRLLHFPGSAPRSPSEIREVRAVRALDELDRDLLAWLREVGPTS